MDHSNLKILQYLNRFGAGVDMDISSVLRELYPLADRMDYKQVAHESKNIHRLLISMKNNGLLNFKNYSLGKGDKKTGLAWIHVTPVYASITEKGKMLLEGKSRHQVEESPVTTYTPSKLKKQQVYSTSRDSKQIRHSIFGMISIGLLLISVFTAIRQELKPSPPVPVKTNSSPEDEKKIRAEFEKIKNIIRKNREDSGKGKTQK